MKKSFLALLLVLAMLVPLGGTSLAADDPEAWKAAPVITSIYEFEKEKLIVEWEGSAELFQVYLDGKMVSTVNLCGAVIDVKPGRHQIQIMPIKLESKNTDTSLSIKLGGPEAGSSFFGKIGLGEIGLDLDLAALGVDPKDILQGSRSTSCSFSYNSTPLFSAVPEITGASTDFKDRVILSFTDKYNSDLYRIGIKSGKDVNYVEFDPSAAATKGLVTKSNTSVTVALDPDYLRKNGCMIPELNSKYGFTVALEKYAVNLTNGAAETSMLHESKESKAYSYTPTAAWKTAPEITYASQTADGQITLRWDHQDNGLGCQYEVREITKTLGVRRGEVLLGCFDSKEIVLKDLMNGAHFFTVTPVLARESGSASEESSVEIKNDWVIAPTLNCTALSGHRVKLTWPAANGVESYHITVYAGDGSLLRFVNLDFKKYKEFDVTSKPGQMEYTFTCGNDILSPDGVKLRFEIYGIRHAANGTEQRSSVTRETIVIK